jgi:hypothetical protein
MSFPGPDREKQPTPGTGADQKRSSLHTGPNSVPPTGVHETYQFIPLKGEANVVLSLFEPVMGAVAKTGKA